MTDESINSTEVPQPPTQIDDDPIAAIDALAVPRTPQ